MSRMYAGWGMGACAGEESRRWMRVEGGDEGGGRAMVMERANWEQLSLTMFDKMVVAFPVVTLPRCFPITMRG